MDTSHNCCPTEHCFDDHFDCCPTARITWFFSMCFLRYVSLWTLLPPLSSPAPVSVFSDFFSLLFASLSLFICQIICSLWILPALIIIYLSLPSQPLWVGSSVHHPFVSLHYTPVVQSWSFYLCLLEAWYLIELHCTLYLNTHVLALFVGRRTTRRFLISFDTHLSAMSERRGLS